MSAPLSFLGGAVVAWIAIRAASAVLSPETAPAATPPPIAPLLDNEPLANAAQSSPQGYYPPQGYAQPQAYAPQQAYSPQAFAYPPGYPPPGYAPQGYYPPPGYAAAAYAPAAYAPRPISVAAMSRPVIVYVPYPVDRRADRARPVRYADGSDDLAPAPPLYRDDGVELASNEPYPRSRNTAVERFGERNRMGADAPGEPTSTPALTRNGRLDRLSVSSWALIRPADPLAAATAGANGQPLALASNGTLGGSQAGARITYRFNRAFAASLRVSGPIEQKTAAGEAAFGVSFQPFAKIPFRLMAERRQAIGKGAGRSDFALLAEGGVFGQPMPYGFLLDGYAQGGVVGIKARDLFADGGFTLTRPLLKRFAIGAGVWGGIQPGLSRLDVGPRVSMRLRRNIGIHLDYRVHLVGNARPGTGPAVTLAGDF